MNKLRSAFEATKGADTKLFNEKTSIYSSFIHYCKSLKTLNILWISQQLPIKLQLLNNNDW